MTTNNNLTDSITDRTTGLLMNKSLVLPNASGNGIKVNNTNPQFGWQDLLGNLVVKGSGVTNPNFAIFIGNISAYQFSNTGAPGSGQTFYCVYHMPHDWAPGTDIYWHVHWAHNSASVTTGAVTFQYEVSYAKGFNQAPFSTSVLGTVTQNASTIQYQHMVAEGQLSVAGGSGTQLNTTNLEVDGIIILAFSCSANTISAATNPFIFTADIHYQSTGISTKNKAPNFYT